MVIHFTEYFSIKMQRKPCTISTEMADHFHTSMTKSSIFEIWAIMYFPMTILDTESPKGFQTKKASMMLQKKYTNTLK